jgi:DNA-binding response OmpR family regulator/AraC-like DNA-binding protein
MVLVVDDDAAVCDAVALTLEDHYRVTIALEGTTALARLRAEPVDAVVLDILLPNVDGLQILWDIKRIAPGVPVIMLSGLGMAGPAVTAMKLGAFDYVTKPFDDRLASVIQSALTHRNAERDAPAAPRAAPGDEPQADIVLAGRDARVLVTLQLLVAARCARQTGTVATTVGEVAEHLTKATPALAIVDDSLPRHELFEIGRTLRASAADCAIIVGCRPPWDSALLRELDRFKPAAMMPTPYDLNGVLHRVAMLLAPKGIRLNTALPLSLHITKAIEYVCGNYRTTTLRGAAGAAAMSSSYLSRLFHAEFGISFREYVTVVRLAAAKALLIESDRKLSSIAELVGFSDAPHLCRLFKRHTGLSPSDFRLSAMGGMPRG